MKDLWLYIWTFSLAGVAVGLVAAATTRFDRGALLFFTIYFGVTFGALGAFMYGLTRWLA